MMAHMDWSEVGLTDISKEYMDQGAPGHIHLSMLKIDHLNLVRYRVIAPPSAGLVLANIDHYKTSVILSQWAAKVGVKPFNSLKRLLLERGCDKASSYYKGLTHLAPRSLGFYQASEFYSSLEMQSQVLADIEAIMEMAGDMAYSEKMDLIREVPLGKSGVCEHRWAIAFDLNGNNSQEEVNDACISLFKDFQMPDPAFLIAVDGNMNICDIDPDDLVSQSIQCIRAALIGKADMPIFYRSVKSALHMLERTIDESILQECQVVLSGERLGFLDQLHGYMQRIEGLYFSRLHLSLDQ